ncbi:MAG TPA: hypothetical protein VFI92_01035 [Steroidobacteraceae bacterium]|nr:hypothetical protein [Steroidobacteraceae bacterium]
MNSGKDDRGKGAGRAPEGEDSRGERGAGRGPSGWPDMQGEGNRDAAREYNESQRDFVESGEVDRAAREAEPRSEAERAEMEEAERKGRSPARQ